MTNECVIDQRPTPDGYACSHCAAQTAQKLAAIVDLAPEARNVAYGLQRGSQGGASGKPGSRSPGNDDALDALAAIQGELTTWARVVAEERGLGIPVAFAPDDQIVRCAQWLGEHIEWLRHREFCDEAYTAFAETASKLRWIVDGPSAKKYLGPCGAPILPNDCDHPSGTGLICDACGGNVASLMTSSGTCEGDVYGRAGAEKGSCRTCGATVDQAERRAWLDDQVIAHTADTPLRAKDIAHAIRVNVNTIRTWSHTVYDDRGEVRRAAKLSSYWWDGQRYVPWVEPREGEDVKARGPRLHYVADVQKLAREAAERRAVRERRDTHEAAA